MKSTLTAAALIIALPLFSACMTGPDRSGEMDSGQSNLISSVAEWFKPEPGNAATNVKLQSRAWGKIISETNVRPIDDKRIRIDVPGSYAGSIDHLEYYLLARAAGEARRAGSAEFVFLNVEYDDPGFLDFLVPSLSLSESDWIGSYEELLAEREQQTLLRDVSYFGFKNIRAVVYFPDEQDIPARSSFQARDVYFNMLNTILFNERDYPYPD